MNGNEAQGEELEKFVLIRDLKPGTYSFQLTNK
jgi:hypothetical protein